MLKKLAFGLIGLALVAILILVLWYQIDGQPLPETDAFLNGPGFDFATESNDGLVFTPHESNGRGLLIMHGALIKPLSYAKTAAYFAERGYTVYLPSGAARLSVNAVDAAAERLAKFDVDDWFIIGHSMGGFASVTLVNTHPVNVRALALWAAAMPADFSHIELPTLFLWGDNDGLLPQGRFDAAISYLPANTTVRTLEGANHRDFAMYSHQFFDNESVLGWQRQIDSANKMTAAFFASHF